MNSILRFSSLFFILFGAFTFSQAANAQGCDKLFISEYIEGWGNNKALELYNPTDNGVDLSDYRIERYSNGATAAADNQKLTLSGIMPPNTVIVIVSWTSRIPMGWISKHLYGMTSQLLQAAMEHCGHAPFTKRTTPCTSMATMLWFFGRFRQTRSLMCSEKWGTIQVPLVGQA